MQSNESNNGKADDEQYKYRNWNDGKFNLRQKLSEQKGNLSYKCLFECDGWAKMLYWYWQTMDLVAKLTDTPRTPNDKFETIRVITFAFNIFSPNIYYISFGIVCTKFQLLLFTISWIVQFMWNNSGGIFHLLINAVFGAYIGNVLPAFERRPVQRKSWKLNAMEN